MPRMYAIYRSCRTHFLLLFVMLLPIASFGGETFRIFAPSRASESLYVVRATEEEDHLDLQVERQVSLGFAGATIVAHPKHPLLYVSSPRSSEDGKPIAGAVIKLSQGPSSGAYHSHQAVQFQHGYCYLSIDKTQRYLLGVAYFGGHVDVYALTPTGDIAKQAFALAEGREHAHCVLPTPDNRFVYIPYVKDTNGLYQYQLETSGKLTPLDPKSANPPAGTGPRHMTHHPRLPIVYFSNEQHLGVSVYSRSPTGQLTLKQLCDFPVPAGNELEDPRAGLSSSDILMTRDAKFLFAGIRGHRRDIDGIARYRIQSDGSLAYLGLTPTDKIPWGLALSPTGKHLVVSAYQGGSLAVMRIGPNGSLKQVARIAVDQQISDLVCR